MTSFIYKNNLYMRLFCLMLCFFIIFSMFIFQYQEAHAFVPLVIAGVAIAPEVVAAGITLLTAAGLCFASTPAAQSAFTEFYSRCSTNLRNNLNSIGTGIQNVSDTIWTATRDWVKSKFGSSPAQTIEVDSTYHETTDLTGVSIPFSLQSNVVFPIGDSFTVTEKTIGYVASKNAVVGDTFFLERFSNSNYPGFYNFVIKFNGVVSGGYVFYNSNNYSARLTANSSYQFYIYLKNGTYRLGASTVDYQGESCFVELMQFSNCPVSQVHYTPYTVATSDFVSNAAYDFKKVDGTRTINVPENPDLTVGKTYNDVQNPIIPYSNTWIGTFRQCVPTGDYTFTGSGTYTGTMSVSTTGSWVGEWTATEAGIHTWTGTYTASDSTTWTGSTVESVPPVSWDYSNWRIPADVIKTKFPFSIPWDLKNAITSLVATPQAPHWTFEFPSNIFVGGGELNIDFSQFEVWAKIIRWGVLISFNIFLILATRRIIGAGG